MFFLNIYVVCMYIHSDLYPCCVGVSVFRCRVYRLVSSLERTLSLSSMLYACASVSISVLWIPCCAVLCQICVLVSSCETLYQYTRTHCETLYQYTRTHKYTYFRFRNRNGCTCITHDLYPCCVRVSDVGYTGSFPLSRERLLSHPYMCLYPCCVRVSVFRCRVDRLVSSLERTLSLSSMLYAHCSTQGGEDS